MKNSEYNEMRAKIEAATGKKVMFITKVREGETVTEWSIAFASEGEEWEKATFYEPKTK